MIAKVLFSSKLYNPMFIFGFKRQPAFFKVMGKKAVHKRIATVTFFIITSTILVI